MSRSTRDRIVNIICIFVIIFIMYSIGFNVGKGYHEKENKANLSRYYYGTIQEIVRNKGVVRISANNQVYEIGYNDSLVNGSNTVLIEVDNNGTLINVWNLAYNIEGNS